MNIRVHEETVGLATYQTDDRIGSIFDRTIKNNSLNNFSLLEIRFFKEKKPQVETNGRGNHCSNYEYKKYT